METEFIGLLAKRDLFIKLEQGDKKAIEFTLEEISRLESIIRDYEIVLKISREKLESSTFKKPDLITLAIVATSK